MHASRHILLTEAPITIASYQLRDSNADVGQNAKTIRHCLEWADLNAVAILCLPEAFLTGYHQDEEPARANAVDLSGKGFGSILSSWTHFDATLIVGLIEVARGALYNTAVVVERGELLGKYRKAHQNEQIFDAGTESPTFLRDQWRFGINICNDANFPAAAAQLARQRADIIFYPLNNRMRHQTAETWRPRSLQNLKDRGQETKCWIVSSDVVFEGPDEVSFGCTAIVDPEGRVVARAAEFHEAPILTQAFNVCPEDARGR